MPVPGQKNGLKSRPVSLPMTKHSAPEQSRSAPWFERLFVPILAGATLRERAVACLGAFLGVGLVAVLSIAILGTDEGLPYLVASIAASAVLVFVVPASPLAQPWPVIGGNVISAMVGVMVARLVPEPALAAPLTAAIAIAVMSLTRSLHPPGAATALMAALGGSSVQTFGFLFPFVPVGMEAAILVVFAIGFHRLMRRRYPHSAVPVPTNVHETRDPPAESRVGFQQADVDAALARLDETFDIDRGDLDLLLREVALQATLRSAGPLLCSDVMSRDIVTVGRTTPAEDARALLLRHNIRTLPVVDGEKRLEGIVGLRNLAHAHHMVEEAMAPAATGAPDSPALALLPVLTDGRNHAVAIVDAADKLVGLVTQTDLLAAVAGLPFVATRS